MQIKLKTGIIMLICGIIFGAVGAGIGGYCYLKQSISKYSEAITRARATNLKLQQEIRDSREESKRLTKATSISEQSSIELTSEIRQSRRDGETTIEECRRLIEEIKKLGNAK